LSFSELSQKIYIPAKVDKTLDKSVFSVWDEVHFCANQSSEEG
jgi:hypothetical protein